MSRRSYEKITRPEALAARESRYRQSSGVRRELEKLIGPSVVSDNKRYWRQRYSEQYAIVLGVSPEEAKRRMDLPGSSFNRLWSRAELEGFQGGPNSAWDRLAFLSGAKGGMEDESERSRYLAIIAWYMRNDTIGHQPWLVKGGHGQFVYPGLPDSIASRE